MKPACPHCFAVAEYEDHGGLFSIRCPVCGWKVEGTVSYPLGPRAEPGQALVAKSASPVSATALRVIRVECKSAAAATLADLRAALTSESGFWLGYLPQYRADELRAKLSHVGIKLEHPPKN